MQTRRKFLRTAVTASTAALAFPAILRAQAGGPPLSERLNIACVGLGGRGRVVLKGLESENFVAFCDVDEARGGQSFKAHPGVPRFRDYRQMLDQMGKQIDAVTVATPDHMHFPIAVAALQLGKHVFVEKPLTHTIGEARRLAKLARERRVATQMGNQGHAGEGPRLLKEWFAAGVLGDVREVKSWTDRPGHFWSQGVEVPDHGAATPSIPSTLDWDLWLGVAPARDYDPAYVPFKWRGFWDFGTGALGDMGAHIIDAAFDVLKLDAPSSVEAVTSGANDDSGPTGAVVSYEYPARGALPALRFTWHEGGLKPALPDAFEAGRRLPGNGTIFIGSKATVITDTYCNSVRIVPEKKMQALAPTLPSKTLPRVAGGHFAEWVRACKGGPAAGSNFDYSSRLTEMLLLANVAVRAGRRIEWDATAGRVTNIASANQYLTKEYRPGFGV